MGPPELPGGNRRFLGSSRRARIRFNGAAGITRRKLSIASTVAESVRRLQWGRRNYPAETTDATAEREAASARFNGAAGITRRKLRRAASQPGHAGVASMGPPELPGGNQVVAETDLNKGTALQWGRRNYPAETTPRAPRSRRRDTASMGPPELPGGNMEARGELRVYPGVLQWGRRNYPAETRAGPISVDQARPGFNGAAGITRRKRGAGQGRDTGAGASMGPPELPGGNFREAYTEVARKNGLQWGRRNYPAETHRIHRQRGSAIARFNGAAGITRRKHRRKERQLRPNRHRFNGAAGITRRKQEVRVLGHREHRHASMGPPELPGGNDISGGHTMVSGWTLQWGRRNYPAETSRG